MMVKDTVALQMDHIWNDPAAVAEFAKQKTKIAQDNYNHVVERVRDTTRMTIVLPTYKIELYWLQHRLQNCTAVEEQYQLKVDIYELRKKIEEIEREK